MTDMEKEAARVVGWNVVSMLTVLLVGGFFIVKLIDRKVR
jgi:hypothetical protein